MVMDRERAARLWRMALPERRRVVCPTCGVAGQRVGSWMDCHAEHARCPVCARWVTAVGLRRHCTVLHKTRTDPIPVATPNGLLPDRAARHEALARLGRILGSDRLAPRPGESRTLTVTDREAELVVSVLAAMNGTRPIRNRDRAAAVALAARLDRVVQDTRRAARAAALDDLAAHDLV